MIDNTHIKSEQIKVWNNAYKFANEKNLLNEFLFYLELKAISKCGIIKNYVTVIEQFTNESKRNIENKIAKLKRKGFLKYEQTKNGEIIKLNSYGEIYEILGIKNCKKTIRTFNILKKIKKNKIVKIKILPFFNIKLQNIQIQNNEIENNVKFDKNALKLEIQHIEIKKSLRKQEYTIKKKYIEECFIEEHGTNYIQKLSKGKKVIHRKEYLKFYDIEKFREAQLHMLGNNPLANININYDVTLSCSKLANMFGYKQANSGLRIQKELKKAGLIEIEKRLIEIGDCKNYESFQEMKRIKYNNSTKVFYRGGKIWLNYTNKISVFENIKNNENNENDENEIIIEEIENHLNENKDYINTEISYYGGFNDVRPKTIKIIDMLNNIKNGEHENLVNIIRTASKDMVKDRKSKSLPTYTPSAKFNDGRNINSKYEHTGLICLDIDNSYSDILKEIICNNEYVFSCFKSISGKGLAVLIKIIPEFHKETFEALKHYFNKRNIILDAKCSDIPRARFITHDENLYLNENSKLYNFKAKKIN